MLNFDRYFWPFNQPVKHKSMHILQAVQAWLHSDSEMLLSNSIDMGNNLLPLLMVKKTFAKLWSSTQTLTATLCFSKGMNVKLMRYSSDRMIKEWIQIYRFYWFGFFWNMIQLTPIVSRSKSKSNKSQKGN